jgi:hypothetical protein
MNVIYICEGEYIQRYEDIHTNFSTCKFQNNCIYYTIILNVIITKAPLCNIKLNIVQLVGSKIFVLYSVAFNMFNFVNIKHVLYLLNAQSSKQTIQFKQDKMVSNPVKIAQINACHYYVTFTQAKLLISRYSHKDVSVCRVKDCAL